MPSYIALAIPAFFLLIGVELLVARRRGQLAYYDFDDSITNLGCGIGQQVVGVLLKALLAGGYVWVWQRSALWMLAPSAVSTWLLAFVGVDFAYYWWHRASHRTNLLWAVHVVHHQSEEYNLSVALRQAWFSSLTSLPFYLPLAVVGVPPAVFFTTSAFSTLYQFWIHSRLIGALGPLELVLNTASHHRVHHAVNPRYLDRNYGATLIVWDRLFGTFAAEDEPAVYGTIKGFASRNALWANFDSFAHVMAQARAMTRLGDKLRVWWAPPEWRPAELGGPHRPEQAAVGQFSTSTPRALRAYVAAHFVATAAATMALLMLAGTLSLPARAVTCGLILATTAVWGGLFERKGWALPLEGTRLVVLAGSGLWLMLAAGSAALGLALVALSLGSAVWLVARAPVVTADLGLRSPR